MLRVAKTALGAIVLGSVLLSGASTLAAATPAGGTLKVFITPSTSGKGGGTALLTGAVGDYGKSNKANSAGKPDKNGKYNQLVLKKGTILVDRRQLVAAQNSAQPTDFNSATCSASLAVTAPVPIVSGTKAYAGITGSVTVTETVAFIGPLTKSGQCDTSANANPVAEWGTVLGSGTVSFS